MHRRNCWEVMKCGREPGGQKAGERGICPAAVANEYDGVNKGRHAGRFCWVVSGTLCKGEVQGTFAKRFKDCLNCRFLKLVEEEEGRFFALTPKDAYLVRRGEAGSLSSSALLKHGHG